MRILFFFLRFVLLAGIFGLIWWVVWPRPDFVILFRNGRVEFRGKFPEALRLQTIQFLQQDVLLRGLVKISGRHRRDGSLSVEFSGPVFAEDRQRIRNFLTTVM